MASISHWLYFCINASSLIRVNLDDFLSGM